MDGRIQSGLVLHFTNEDFAISFAKKYQVTARFVSILLKTIRTIVGVIVAILRVFLFFKYVDFKDKYGLIILLPIILICFVIWASIKFTVLKGKKLKMDK